MGTGTVRTYYKTCCSIILEINTYRQVEEPYETIWRAHHYLLVYMYERYHCFFFVVVWLFASFLSKRIWIRLQKDTPGDIQTYLFVHKPGVQWIGQKGKKKKRRKNLTSFWARFRVHRAASSSEHTLLIWLQRWMMQIDIRAEYCLLLAFCCVHLLALFNQCSMLFPDVHDAIKWN